MRKREITSLEELNRTEEQIRRALSPHRLDTVLTGLRGVQAYSPAFIIAGCSLFAVRYCRPQFFKRSRSRELIGPELYRLMDLVGSYLLADPLSFDASLQQAYINENPAPTILRLAYNQFAYNIRLNGHYSRAMLLFDEIPAQLATKPNPPHFDFEASFRLLTGVSARDFIKVGYVVSAIAASDKYRGFRRGDVEKVRPRLTNFPSADCVQLVLEQIAATPSALQSLFHRRREQQQDRRFAMYDFNPLFQFPLIRPFLNRKAGDANEDRMIAPVPYLVVSRVSIGMFYQMYNAYGTAFSDYFGDVFEAYIGRVLAEAVNDKVLLSENDIRQTYRENNNKVPDWTIVEGDTAILIECKATRFNLTALATGREDSVNASLKQVLKACRQLYEFRNACEEGRSGLEQLATCTRFVPVIVILEPIHLVNNPFFRDYINERLKAEGIDNLDWIIVTMEELEWLQPHFAAGVSFSTSLENLATQSFEKVIETIRKQTGRSYRDSFLYLRDIELFRELNIPSSQGDSEEPTNSSDTTN